MINIRIHVFHVDLIKPSFRNTNLFSLFLSRNFFMDSRYRCFVLPYLTSLPYTFLKINWIFEAALVRDTTFFQRNIILWSLAFGFRSLMVSGNSDPDSPSEYCSITFSNPFSFSITLSRLDLWTDVLRSLIVFAGLFIDYIELLRFR